MSRRTVLKITGAAGITTAIAGCGGGPGNGNGNDTEDGEEPAGDNTTEEEEPAVGEEENETEDGNETNETENETEDGNETDEESMDGGEAIEPDTQIVLEAQTSGWVGVEPEQIADDENPTITLQQDESYEIGWEEGDGSQHNIELVDENDEVVDDYQTEESSEGGEDQFIEFDATDEIAEYVCRPHESTMRGTIELEEGDGGAMEGNETEGNETEEMGNESEDNATEDNESEDNESEDNATEDNESDE